MSEHELKLWPVFFDDVAEGRKTFELRRDDRGFELGDTLWLRHWDPNTEQHNGRSIGATIVFVYRGTLLAPDVACLGIRVDWSGYAPERDETAEPSSGREPSQ